MMMHNDKDHKSSGFKHVRRYENQAGIPFSQC